MPTRARTTEPRYRFQADLFKCLAHPTRIQVLEVLAADDEGTPVTQLLTVTGCEASSPSRHLAVPHRSGLGTSTRSGKPVDCRLARPIVAEPLVVARAFLVSTSRPDTGRLAAARRLPPLPGAGLRAVLDAVEVNA